MADLLKDMYSHELIDQLASALVNQDRNVNKEAFVNAILDEQWNDRALKDRANHITKQIHSFIPYSYKEQIEILDKIAPLFNGLTAIIFPTFVEMYGSDDFDTSLKALKRYTPYSTSEFAIRPFLAENPKIIETLYQWAKDNNYHVRRLASEGCRPLLPWAMKLNQYVKDPSPIIPILEQLYNDPEDYVYRSVANNLNDISKNHPELVLELAEKWFDTSKTSKWVCKHGLRTLLKKGNQRAMQLFGFGSIDSVLISKFQLKNISISIGNSTTLEVDIINEGNKAKFRIECSVSYLKKNGSHNEKVFQLRESIISSKEKLSFTKKIDFKDLSTRKHYPGKHFIDLKVNGHKVRQLDFILE